MARTPGATNLTAEQVDAIHRLSADGAMTYVDIAHALGLKKSTVAKHAIRHHGYRHPATARRPLTGSAAADI